MDHGVTGMLTQDYDVATKTLAEAMGWTLVPGNADTWFDSWVNAYGEYANHRWFTSPSLLMTLMVTELDGYYEARHYGPDHCIVIGIPSHERMCWEETVVVYLRDHHTKELALAYAVVLAVTRKYNNIKAVNAFLEKKAKQANG
jgi:hypothetical protein